LAERGLPVSAVRVLFAARIESTAADNRRKDRLDAKREGERRVAELILFLAVVAFAWNLGVHYTGAVMGMAYSARAIATWPALALIALFAVLGATFASGGVQTTVGLRIIPADRVTTPEATVIVVAGGLLTLFYNYRKIPTSTIQILVFCIVGVGLAGDLPIAWRTILRLAILWIIAPFAACALGFLFTRLLDLAIPPDAARAQVREQIAPLQGATDAQAGAIAAGARPVSSASWSAWFPTVAEPLAPDVRRIADRERPSTTNLTLAALRWLPGLLVLVGVFASFVMGANDVSNATGAFIMTGAYSTRAAGLIGGLAMAVGVLTWGKRILRTIAFDVVHMDLSMASAAQGVQGLVVIAAVSQGLFTSMNQALIGAMAGTGLARGQQTVKWGQLRAIFRGWLFGPISGILLAGALEFVVRAL
jgi:phosphate/sulfate permease